MNNEEKILELLSTLVSKVDNLEQGQQKIELRLDKLEQGQKKLEQGQKQLQSDMKEVKINVKYIWEDLSRQEKRIDRLAN